VTGGAVEGTTADRANYVNLLLSVRNAIGSKKILTIAGAAGNWVLDVGFDLTAIIAIVDWVNIMTYDYFGPWKSKWGAYVGPNAPLYFGAPPGYSGKLNVDYTTKYWTCYTGRPDKLVMGIGFYGRYWNNVNPTPVNGSGAWRMASLGSHGLFDGGALTYEQIKNNYLNDANYVSNWDNPTQTPYLYNSQAQVQIAYDNTRSIQSKLDYASKHVNTH